jgi:glycosyltransferase involved in cell wall biosynthesis
VPGERAAFYARFLGFRSEQIERGLFSIDIKQYAASFEQRKTLPAYPQRFLYVGRYAKEKRLDVLIKAYQIYRKQVRVPWALDCVGMGTAMTCLANVEGVRDLGFVQPQAMAEIYATHGAFVLASDFDPWPLVIAEAAASGLPVVCTDACGSHVDLVRSYYNGVVCGTASPVSLANGMMWIHENASDLLSIGGRGMDLVKPYSSEMWAVRVATLAKNCT